MSRWVAYTIAIVLGGFCLFAFDRVLVAEHDCGELRCPQPVCESLSRNISLFLQKRSEAMATACALMNEAETNPLEALSGHFDAVFGRVADLRFVRVVMCDGESTEVYSNSGQSIMSSETTALPVRGTNIRIERTPDGQLDILAFASHFNNREVYIWGRFGTDRALRSSDTLAAGMDAYLADSQGNPIIGTPRGDPSEYVMSKSINAFGRSWDFRSKVAKEPWHELPMRRAILLGLGIIMIGGIVAVFSMQNRHYREILDNNLELAQQADQHRFVVDRLLRLNRDLDEFTYVVSHDLKEPLRGVEGIAKLLNAEYGDRLDDTGRDYLESLRASGKKMRRLVDDLLRLSRVTRKRFPLENVDFSELIRETLHTMNYQIVERKADIAVQPHLPSIFTDRVRLSELFQNLVSNALKFTRAERPKIEIGYEPLPDAHMFWVQDDGIGIPPEDRERIFNIFQRTASAEFGDGSGVGLTICKRIIENLGGRIWVESGGEGARFCFTLPAQNTHSSEGPQQASGGYYERITAQHSIS